MKHTSIWLEDISKENCQKLNQNIEVDVLIVGGGITGLSCAYHLKDKGLNIALVEQNQIGHGVSSRTTGKITYFQEVLLDIEKSRGLNETKLYVESQKEAINLTKQIIEKHQIDCDFIQNNSFLLTKNNHNLFIKHQNLWHQLKLEVDYPNDDIAYVKDAYTFHPVKFMNGLKRLVQHIIYEQTKVIKIEHDPNGYRCYTKDYQIFSRKVIIASHYPFFTIPFFMPLKTYIEHSMLFASKNEFHSYHALTLDKPIMSWRFYKDYLITLYPSVKVAKAKEADYLWTNNDVMTYDGLPFIGAIDKRESLYIATGYNTWGMTNGILAGKIISDLLLHQSNPYQALFNPKRLFNLSYITSLVHIVSRNVKGFVVRKNRSNNVYYEKRNGIKVAIYIDENKKEHVVKATCPHLCCQLVFNEAEKTWDCPCHGSRFDLEGRVIEGPSQYDISI